MSAFVLVEHNNQTMHPATRNALAAALQLDPNPTLLVVGSNCSKVAEEAAGLKGVHAVLSVD
jgi:electron transfer flavoprotein alpha subunit